SSAGCSGHDSGSVSGPIGTVRCSGSPDSPGWSPAGDERAMHRKGNEGYTEEADALARQYESVRFVDVHGPTLHLLPTLHSDVLDSGAGTGRDAAALAAMGHRVVAVEPTAALRDQAMLLHPSPRIEWIDDTLPHLARLVGRGDRFDVILLTAVWIHL